MKKIVIILLFLRVSNLHSNINIKFNKDLNALESLNVIETINQKSKKTCENCCKVFTPIAPYDMLTCVVTAPKTVFVGHPFTIDYAINVRSNTYVSFWADLLPTAEQMIAQGIRLVHYTAPTIGEFDEHAESTIHKNGKGIWRFDRVLPVGTHHISFTFEAQGRGMKSFTTLLATNPPSYIAIGEINAVEGAPLVQNDYAQGYDNQPVLIPVLDNDYGYSALSIINVSEPHHGNVMINSDNSLTYTSNEQFEGVDNFTYTVQDTVGNTAQGSVEVKICKKPAAQIIKLR